MKELCKFIGSNKVYILLLLISTGISFASLFFEYKWITVCGFLLTLVIAIINKWKSYKYLQDLEIRISSYDEAFHTERNKDNNITGLYLDCGTF